MGNTGNVGLKHGATIKITERLVQDVQDQICLVDSSVSGLFKTIDSLKVACEMFLRQLDNKDRSFTGSQNTKTRSKTVDENAEETAVHLLRLIYASFSDQKKTALGSIRQLLHSIKTTGRTALNLQEEDMVLSIDECIAPDDEDEIRPYYETRVELLREELNVSHKLNQNYKDHISVLDKKVMAFEKEVEACMGRIKAMEIERKKYEETREKIAKENKSLEIMLNEVRGKENKQPMEQITTTEDLDFDMHKELKKVNDADPGSFSAKIQPGSDEEIETLKRQLEQVTADKELVEAEMKSLKTMQCIHVQTINRSCHATTLSMLEKMFETRISTAESKLCMTEQQNETKLNAALPLIVFCTSIQGLAESANRALEGIKGVENVALVVMHKVENASSIQQSENVLLNPKFKKLSGIFDVAYSYINGVYQCDLNDRNIAAIVKFIRKKGVKKSAIETYGLIPIKD